MGRVEDHDDDGSAAAPPIGWDEWVISTRWKVRMNKGFGLANYDYAEPRVKVVTSRYTSVDDAEHDAFVALAHVLIGLHHDASNAEADLVRERWSQTAKSKPGKDRIEWTTTVAVQDLDSEAPGWVSIGVLPLVALLKRRAYPNLPDPRQDPEQRRVATEGIAKVRAALAAATSSMKARHGAITAPITPHEYQDAKAEGWDRFGDPGRPNDLGPCSTCRQPATRYDPEGAPVCDAHQR
jgi:hypothetical protein